MATSASSSTVTPADHSPAGAVEVSSAVDAAERPALLWFAGSPASEPNVSQRTAELGDELVVVTADGRHRFRSGLEATFRRYRAEPGESNGTFLFRSLRDLEENRVTLFTRSFDLQPREADERRWTIFADDRWRTATFQVSYGLRAERWSVAGGRAPDAQILSRFEPLTAVVPSSWQVSPRIGFAFAARMPWNRPGGAKTEFQGGVGRFVGALGLSELAAALAENGAPETAPVVCIGSAAPVPDWAAYREDPSSAPTACREGSSSGSERLPSATLFAPGFSPPQAVRASLGARGIAPGLLVWRINAAFVRGSHQPLAFDRNLRTTPAFTNTAEGGRPVYSPPGEIDPGTGLLPLAASRRFPELGHVRALTAEGRSRTLQLSLSASKLTTRITALAGYTWTDAVDDVGPLVAVGGNGGSVGSDPNRAESAASPYTPRHLLFASAEWRRSSHLTFTLFARASSGFLFTPMVNGDANGDGTTNDRAFVFEPAPGESGVHTDMARLLDGASAPLRGCLARQVGRVAAANSCSTAPFASADLRVAVQLGPRMPRSPNRRMTLWLVARNLPSGLDYLLHGPEHLRGWGQPMSVDNTLLMVRGFDPATRTFRYEVNPGFGRPPASGLLRPSVFAVGIQARIAIGADRVDAAFQESIDAGSNRRRTLTPEALAAHFAGQLPDLSAEVLRQNAPSRLYLTPAQAAALQQRSDSVAPLVARLLTELTRAAQSAPGAVVGIPDGPLNALVREAVALRRADADAVRTILSLDQWRQLPAALRATESPFLPYPAERITSPPEY